MSTENNQTKSIILYNAPDIEKLKYEIKILNLKLNELRDKRDDLLCQIYDYNRLYYLKLGNIIEKILKLKNSKFNDSKTKNKPNLEKLDLKSVYRKLKELKNKSRDIKRKLNKIQKNTFKYKELLIEYNRVNNKIYEIENNFKSTYKANYNKSYTYVEDFKPLGKRYIDTENYNELRVLYKKACRLCHPDIVPKNIQEIAEKIFKNLNEAYNLGNIKEVEYILLSLENGIYFDTVNTVPNKNFLKNYIIKLKINIDKTIDDIKELELNETIKIIQNYSDLYEYFKIVKKDLEEEYRKLKNEI